MQSKGLESYHELGKVIELFIPVDEYWKIQQLIAKANYLYSSGESAAEIKEVYKKVMSYCSQFAIREDERKWLNEKSAD
ncbi:MAG: hypothetical protein HQK54_04730 [Oligoflexales bacterium]|nr:hypothetical protein [Oligoflexales bacterium]